MLPNAVADCFFISEKADDHAYWFLLELKNGVARDRLIALLAEEIARSCADPSETAFIAWLKRYNGGGPHDEATAAEVKAYIQADFKVLASGNNTRLHGAIVEHLWGALVEGLAGGWGKPVVVARDHFSVIDHGGDGLCFYESDGAGLRFRLWESKSHTALSTSVTTTITRAANQLKKNGAEYIARISKVMQVNSNEHVAEMSGEITKLWTAQDERSAVGVVVGTPATTSVPKRPFRGLSKMFSYEDRARRDGFIVRIDEFQNFCAEVRDHIMRGID